jgi:uncharacterized protein YggE
MTRTWKAAVVAVVVGSVTALVTGGVALGLAAAGPPRAPGASCPASAPQLTVTGTGSATGTPDLLTVVIAVEQTKPAATAALTADDATAGAVTGALEEAGVAAKDVQTTDVTISPQYNSNSAITGYQVRNVITAEVHDLASAGSLVDRLSALGGNAVQIQSLTVSVDDTRALEDQARRQAVAQAVSHARAMAHAAGQRLAQVCSVDDTSSQTVPPLPGAPYGLGATGAAAANASSVPIEAGSQQVSAQVKLVYVLAPLS